MHITLDDEYNYQPMWGKSDNENMGLYRHLCVNYLWIINGWVIHQTMWGWWIWRTILHIITGTNNGTGIYRYTKGDGKGNWGKYKKVEIKKGGKEYSTSNIVETSADEQIKKYETHLCM